MVKLTKPQRHALYRKWTQNTQDLTYRKFRSTITCWDETVFVRWCGMWLGIEKDGYTHS
jgi:hypothetical protein